MVSECDLPMPSKWYVLKKVVYRDQDITNRFHSVNLQYHIYKVEDFLSDIFIAGERINFLWWENNDPLLDAKYESPTRKLSNPIITPYCSPMEFFGPWTG